MMRAAARAGRTATAVAVAVMASACSADTARPAALSGPNEACHNCRMVVSSQRFAAQVAAPGEDPLFFDDIECLSTFVQAHDVLAGGAVAYVADHGTGDWVPAATAVYTSVPGLETPMGSHVIAHGTAASRDADPLARGGVTIPLSTLFPGGVPEGRR